METRSPSSQHLTQYPTLRLGRMYTMNGKHWGPGLVTFDLDDDSQEEVYRALKTKEQKHIDRERHEAGHTTIETNGGPMSYHRVPNPQPAPTVIAAQPGTPAAEPGSVASLPSHVAEQERLAAQQEQERLDEINRAQGESAPDASGIAGGPKVIK